MVRPDFVLDRSNALPISEICARLDGLPLAIELAAARIGLLPPEAMLSRLERRLDLLQSRSTDRPDRQRTLRGAIDWSYGLLDEVERAAFRRLAIFVGGSNRGRRGDRPTPKKETSSICSIASSTTAWSSRKDRRASPVSGCSRRFGSTASTG